ncbi:MAG: Uma2 family endonuclease [Bacteroidetes bacterium]|nr:Uma2 family endonuclease [Fibrella sp.]
METVSLKLSDTLDENELLRLAATWEEYIELADETPYTIQFLNGEIIVSQATDIHEELVGTLIWLFRNAFLEHPALRVLGSNVKIVVPEHNDFNADMSVVRGPSDYALTPTGNVSKSRIKNPEIVVEVLSTSTRKFDMTEKITYYKLIPSLQYILFVDQYRPFASVYARTNVPDEWLNHDYRTLDSVVKLGDLELPMEAIYRKTVFDK